MAWRVFLVALVASALAALMPHAAQAATSCGFSASPTIAFGNYNVYGAAIPSTGTINGVCTTGGSTIRPVITLGKGHSTTYHPRKMPCTSGACLTTFSADVLTYNLYTSAALSTIWGSPAVDATTASVTMPSGCCGSNVAWTATVYGYIPAAISGGANDIAVGGYSDTIVVTMTF